VKMLIRGGWVITSSGESRAILRNGAVYVEDDRIVDVGDRDLLSKTYHFDMEIGSTRSIVMPGFMNIHHHGKGVSTLQRGVADEPLETRLVSYYEHKSDIDTYDDALLAAANEIETGVTTVLHHHYGIEPSSSQEYEDDLQKAGKAWMDSGLRVAFAPFVEDQDEGGIGMIRAIEGESVLPPELRRREDRISTPERTEAYFRAAHALVDRLQGHEDRILILLGPTGPNWCTDELLEKVKKTAQRLKIGIHTHLLETKYHQAYAFGRYGRSQVEHLDRIGFLGPEVSCAHSVWVTEKDISIMARTGCTVVHNASSNLRLFSGIAPVLRMKEQGVNVCMGTDALGINDDEDFFQEIRLCSLLHREPGLDAKKLSSNQVLDMASVAGSRAILSEGRVGEINKGMKADIILLRSDRILLPWGVSQLPMTDLLISRAKSIDVDTVIVNGRILMKERRLITIDKSRLLQRIGEKMPSPREMKKEERELKTWMSGIFRNLERRYPSRS